MPEKCQFLWLYAILKTLLLLRCNWEEKLTVCIMQNVKSTKWDLKFKYFNWHFFFLKAPCLPFTVLQLQGVKRVWLLLNLYWMLPVLSLRLVSLQTALFTVYTSHHRELIQRKQRDSNWIHVFPLTVLRWRWWRGPDMQHRSLEDERDGDGAKSACGTLQERFNFQPWRRPEEPLLERAEQRNPASHWL